ncbi:MAG: substrate-binding periplasmic protein [Candidatus Promineifilaceae bacterium]
MAARTWHLATLALALSLAACRPAGGHWEELQAGGVLRVGLDPTYPPFALAEGEMVAGIDVDLTRAIADRLGLQPRFSYFGYDGLYDALAAGKVDVLTSALVIAPERMGDFAFSRSYFNNGQRLLALRSAGLPDPDGLTAGRLAVELGSDGHRIANGWARGRPQLEVRPYPSAAGAVAAVSQGQATAAILEGVAAMTAVAQEPALEIVGPPLADLPYAVVVRRADETLLSRINTALKALEASGRLDDILADWFGRFGSS